MYVRFEGVTIEIQTSPSTLLLEVFLKALELFNIVAIPTNLVLVGTAGKFLDPSLPIRLATIRSPSVDP